MRRSRQHTPDPSLGPLHAALTADAAAEELTGEVEVLTAYRAVSWERRRSLRRPAVLVTKLGVATLAGVVGLSGVATAAYTGSLPDTLQDVAHKTIKAPKAHPPAQAVGPDATGPAAWGLCQAFVKKKDKDKAEGKEPKAQPTPKGEGKGLAKKQESTPAAGKKSAGKKSVAYRNLVRAAGGEDKLEAYCAAVPRPSGEPESSEGPESSEAPEAPESSEAPEKHRKPTAKPSHAPDRGAGAAEGRVVPHSRPKNGAQPDPQPGKP